MTRRSPRMAFLAPAFSTLMLLFLCVGCTLAGAQQVDSLAQAKTLFVAPFTGADAMQLRNALIRRLRKDGRFRIVSSPHQADAVLRGAGEIWVKGFITVNARTPSSNLQTVYGGYLSIEILDINHQPLWSWLAMPGSLAWSNIVDDLAGRATQKLIEAANSASAPVPAPGATLAQTNLAGGGATFPAPIYQKWFEDFGELHPGVKIRYTPMGSQLGVENLAGGGLDFAGSDVVPEVIVSSEVASHFLRIASVLGGVVPIYNVPGVTQDLRFTPQALADIYLGRVRRWNDPEIRRFNRGVDLPDAPIAVVHRSDGSGTSWVWSDFLSKVSPAWASDVGRGTLLRWPVGTGAEHNEGVAETVQKTPDSIGYVELAYAIQHELSYGAVRNRSGEFIHADIDSLAQAARAAGVVGVPPPSITDPPGKNVYPIAAFTWLLIPAQTADRAKRAALLEMLSWVLTDGQKECSALGYAPLPRETADSQLRMLDSGP